MVGKKKRKGHKVGSSWTTYRKINGKRRKVRVTRVSKTKYRVRVVGKKKKGRRKKMRR